MKKVLLLIVISVVSCKLIAQESFSEFISLFPKYSSWDALPEDVRDIEISDKKLDAGKLNIYMYSDPYRGEAKPVGNNDTRKSPLRMGWNGTYFKGDEGKYANKAEREVSDDSIVTIYYYIYPLARVHINDSICMVFLLYDGPHREDPFSKSLYYEAYTFNILREKVLSSITLFRDAEIFFSYIRKGHYIYIYENYEAIVDSETDETEINIAYRTYYLRDDGYLQLIDNDFLADNKRIASFIVIDSDGYTNVREEPTTQSKILYTIKKWRGGILEITDNPNWYKVIYSNDGIDSPGKDAFIKGWIHKSRVCFYPGRYRWKQGDPQVCKDLE
jgi:hypothetical protein